MNVLIADDHAIVLDGLKLLLKQSKQIDQIHLAQDCDIAEKILLSKPVDIMLVDINMPGKGGLQLIQWCKTNKTHVKILVLSMNGDGPTVHAALKAGASGYMLKNTDKVELYTALEQIYQGKRYFSKEIAETLLSDMYGRISYTEPETTMELTPRELDVLKCILLEYTNKRIADELHISEYTVESHRKNIFRKTNTKTPIGLLRFVMENPALKALLE